MELSPQATAGSSGALAERGGGGAGVGSAWLPDDGDQHYGS